LFRVKFHNELIRRLSPPLQAQVCSMLLGKRIVSIPFFSYAKARELGLETGKDVFVKQGRSSSREYKAGVFPFFDVDASTRVGEQLWRKEPSQAPHRAHRHDATEIKI